MVTKGEIQSIDYGGNTCEVRIPYFESAGINDRIIATATIGNQPGMYNGYRAGDVVWIAFEDGEASKPVVIGKLFLGSEAERGDARGVINVESATASSSMTMPINSNLAYEKDASVAQNGETKYGKISDMANKLATITAQQDKTAYDVTGVVSTGSMLKSEMSSIKAGSGSKSTYQSASRPEETVYEKQEDLSSFSEASSYVGYYIQTGVDKDNKPQYEQVTDANKDSLELYPGITTPYKLRKLSDGDIWIYTGPNLYEEDSSAISWAVADPANLTTLDDYYKYYKKDGKKFTDEDTIVLETNSTEKKTVAYYPNLAGYYVYCEKKDESTFWIKNNNPWTRPCPEESCKDSSKNSDAQKYYPTESGDCVFRLAVSANCDPKDGNYIHPIDANTKKYKLHLAKNQSFYWDGKKQTWVKGSDDRFDEYKSAITQTAEKLQSEFSHTNEKMESYNSSITQTAESITLAVSKTVQGQSKTYAQATKPDTYSKLTESVWKAFKTTADYVGLYLDKDGAKTEVTKDNKDSLSITPGTSEAYSKLNANDVWIYTGEDLYIDAQNDTEDKFDYAKATKTSQYVGHYIRSGTPKPNSPCPHCSITNGDTGMFTLVTAKNKDAWGIMPGATAAYNIHLAKNTTFYWDGSKWVEGTPSTLKAVDSAITQTANAIDAKVSKTYNDGAEKSFGWNISQKEDMPSESEKGSNYHVGDGDGKFVVYSSVKKHADEDAKQTDVLHVNKNGLWVNGNLEVEDDAGQKVFRALPYGDYTEDTSSGTITYDNKPQVQIGSKATVGKESSVWMSPTTDAENDVSIAKSYERKDWGVSCGDSFGVTRDGAVYSTDLVVDGLDFMALTDTNSNIADISVKWSPGQYLFSAERSVAADKMQEVRVHVSDYKIDLTIIIQAGSKAGYSQPIYGLELSLKDYDPDNDDKLEYYELATDAVSWTPRKTTCYAGSFTNTAGYFNDKNYSHLWGARASLRNSLNGSASDEYEKSMQSDEIQKPIQWYATSEDSAAKHIAIGSDDLLWGINRIYPQYFNTQIISWDKDDILIARNLVWTSMSTSRNYYWVFRANKSGGFSSSTKLSYSTFINNLATAGVVLLAAAQTDFEAYLTSKVKEETSLKIFNGDRCTIYIPRTEINEIKSLSVTLYWPGIKQNYSSGFPPMLTVCDITSTSEYHEVTLQATILGITEETVNKTAYIDNNTTFDTYTRQLKIVNTMSTENLYADILCYGTDKYFEDALSTYICLEKESLGEGEYENTKYPSLSTSINSISNVDILNLYQYEQESVTGGADISIFYSSSQETTVVDYTLAALAGCLRLS